MSVEGSAFRCTHQQLLSNGSWLGCLLGERGRWATRPPSLAWWTMGNREFFWPELLAPRLWQYSNGSTCAEWGGSRRPPADCFNHLRSASFPSLRWRRFLTLP